MTARRFGPPESRSPTTRQLARETERQLLRRDRVRREGTLPEGVWWGEQHARVLDRLSHFPKTGRGRWKVDRGMLLVEVPRSFPLANHWRPSDDTDPPWYYAPLPGGLEAIMRDHFAPEEFPLLWLGQARVHYFLPEALAELSIAFATVGAVQRAVANLHTALIAEIREALLWCARRPLAEVERVNLIRKLSGEGPALAALHALGMPGTILVSG